jgi:hypothetical protein
MRLGRVVDENLGTSLFSGIKQQMLKQQLIKQTAIDQTNLLKIKHNEQELSERTRNQMNIKRQRAIPLGAFLWA